MGLLDRLADRTHQDPEAAKKKLKKIKETSDKERDRFWKNQGSN
tara:strand:+ start:498 stop:629 length:132 start_codon:yes stop_codon:yes gene_type:complete